MKIALCDDNERELTHLHSLVQDYRLCHPALDIEIDRFLSVDLLLKQPVDQYDLLFLDILMPQMSGIESVKLLRSEGCHAAVIFVTSSPDFALDAFAVDAMQYLIKPLDSAALSKALDKVLPILELHRAGSMVVSTSDGIKNLYYHNIVFVECARHFAYFHLSDHSTIRSRTLRQSFISYIAPLLADERFVQPHHSFCVNKDYVARLNQRDFELYGDYCIPIAKDRFVEVKSNYLDYLDNRKGVSSS